MGILGRERASFHVRHAQSLRRALNNPRPELRPHGPNWPELSRHLARCRKRGLEAASSFFTLLVFLGSVITLTYLNNEIDFPSTWANAVLIAASLLLPYLVVSFLSAEWIERRVTKQFLGLLATVSVHGPEVMHDVDFKVYVNRKIRRLSFYLDLLPRLVSTSHPEFIRVAREIGAGQRDLQLWISLPIDSTRADIIEIWFNDLTAFASGCWAEMRRTAASSPPRWVAWSYLLAGTVLGAGAFSLGLLGESFGLLHVAGTAILGLASSLCLMRSGLAAEVTAALDLSSRLRSG